VAHPSVAQVKMSSSPSKKSSKLECAAPPGASMGSGPCNMESIVVVQCVDLQTVLTAICSSASVILRNRSAPAVLGHARPEPPGGRQRCRLRRCHPGPLMQGMPGSTGNVPEA
jgi:hypothetical protein